MGGAEGCGEVGLGVTLGTVPDALCVSAMVQQIDVIS